MPPMPREGPQPSSQQTLLGKSKAREKGVLHPTFEDQRDRGYSPALHRVYAPLCTLGPPASSVENRGRGPVEGLGSTENLEYWTQIR